MNAHLMMMVVFWVAALGFGLGAGEREEVALTKEKIPKQQTVTLPTSVHHSVREDGRHVVTIDGIATAPHGKKEKEDRPVGFSQTPMDYIPSIPERVSFDVDDEKLTCALVTTRELSRTELAAAIDETAKWRSEIPYWAELEARDLKRAAEFRDDRYVSKMLTAEAPSGLAWFLLSGSQGLSIPFVVKLGGPNGQLLIVPVPFPASRPLELQRRYTIRVLDHDGQILWMDTSTAFGVSRIAVGDSDEDLQHEIYIESWNAEGKKLFHIAPASEQKDRGEPAPRPESK